MTNFSPLKIHHSSRHPKFLRPDGFYCLIGYIWTNSALVLPYFICLNKLIILKISSFLCFNTDKVESAPKSSTSNIKWHWIQDPEIHMRVGCGYIRRFDDKFIRLLLRNFFCSSISPQSHLNLLVTCLFFHLFCQIPSERNLTYCCHCCLFPQSKAPDIRAMLIRCLIFNCAMFKGSWYFSCHWIPCLWISVHWTRVKCSI